MKITQDAITVVPIGWDETNLIRGWVDPGPVEADFEHLIPPTEDLDHWRAVWTAFDGFSKGLDLAVPSVRAEREREAQQEAEAKRLQGLVVDPSQAPSIDGCLLAAHLPLDPAVPDVWIAIGLADDRYEMKNRWELGSDAVRIAFVSPGTPVVWSFDAQGLVPVELRPTVDIHPQFFDEQIYYHDEGESEWHELEGFDRMPTTAREMALAESRRFLSKVGGFARLNAENEATPVCECGTTMIYSLCLAADFFDCEFGDAGCLHVWVCPKLCGGTTLHDSA